MKDPLHRNPLKQWHVYCLMWMCLDHYVEWRVDHTDTEDPVLGLVHTSSDTQWRDTYMVCIIPTMSDTEAPMFGQIVHWHNLRHLLTLCYHSHIDPCGFVSFSLSFLCHIIRMPWWHHIHQTTTGLVVIHHVLA